MNCIYYKLLQDYVHIGHKRQKDIFLREFKKSSFIDGVRRERVVLELACGIGNFASIFPVNNYTGIDLSSDRIADARKNNPSYYFESCDASGSRARELIQGSNFIFCHGLLHHLNDQECSFLIENIRKFSKKPAVFVAIEPIMPRWYSFLGQLLARLDEGKYIRRPAGCLSFFPEAGLRIERLKYFPRWPVDMEAYIIQYL